MMRFILMSNHVHLLIETPEIPLSKVMQSLHAKYTQYFPKIHWSISKKWAPMFAAMPPDFVALP
jgi:REP element-mobilizing transposase RayT